MTPVKGTLIPWGKGSPVEDRHVTLCRLQDEPEGGLCELMPSAAITDSVGRFELPSVPTGKYFILYDSGLEDFDQAMKEWGGKTLSFGDTDWLSDFLGVDLAAEPVEFRVPEDISHSPHEGWLNHYCTLTLSVGRSPFIIAHDMELAQESRLLSCLIVDVSPGATVDVEIQAAYYGDE